jgi:hypothetical protein
MLMILLAPYLFGIEHTSPFTTSVMMSMIQEIPIVSFSHDRSKPSKRGKAWPKQKKQSKVK